jgi:large subunit ribosomal protein L12
MEYVYSALLLHSAKQPVTEENVKRVLNSIGVKPDDGKVKALIASLEGQSIDELIKQAATVTVAAPAEEKKIEKKEDEEKKEETAAAGLSQLFG